MTYQFVYTPTIICSEDGSDGTRLVGRPAKYLSIYARCTQYLQTTGSSPRRGETLGKLGFRFPLPPSRDSKPQQQQRRRRKKRKRAPLHPTPSPQRTRVVKKARAGARPRPPSLPPSASTPIRFPPFPSLLPSPTAILPPQIPHLSSRMAESQVSGVEFPGLPLPFYSAAAAGGGVIWFWAR